MDNFLCLIDKASRLPNYARWLKQLIVKGMDRQDFEEVLSFFTDLVAGIECFPRLRHLVNNDAS